MSLRKSGFATQSKPFMAKMACDAYLRAQVMDAVLPVSIKKFTDVVAEDLPDGSIAILWTFGDSTAQAIVTRSILYIPPGQ